MFNLFYPENWYSYPIVIGSIGFCLIIFGTISVANEILKFHKREMAISGIFTINKFYRPTIDVNRHSN